MPTREFTVDRDVACRSRFLCLCLRSLVRVGFRVDDIVPTLLEAIGDHQKHIINTIMLCIRRHRYAGCCGWRDLSLCGSLGVLSSGLMSPTRHAGEHAVAASHHLGFRFG